MLKKKLGSEGIEINWPLLKREGVQTYFKVPTTLIIPDGCESIGDGVFYDCVCLREVVIPESVERIGDWAFGGCNRLEKVVIPESVEKIGEYAFAYCEKATVILKKHKKGFEKIGRYAFSGKVVKKEIGN